MKIQQKHLNNDAGQLNVAMTSLSPQGKCFKVFIPCVLSSYFREQNIQKVELLQDKIGGLIVMRPVPARELQKIYDKGRQIYESEQI